MVPLISGTKVITQDEKVEVFWGFASDLMSDVLTVESDQLTLIAGLTRISHNYLDTEGQCFFWAIRPEPSSC